MATSIADLVHKAANLTTGEAQNPDEVVAAFQGVASALLELERRINMLAQAMGPALEAQAGMDLVAQMNPVTHKGN